MASNPIVNMFKVEEIRKRLLFTFLILAVFRLGSVITIPGIDANVLILIDNSVIISTYSRSGWPLLT